MDTKRCLIAEAQGRATHAGKAATGTNVNIGLVTTMAVDVLFVATAAPGLAATRSKAANDRTSAARGMYRIPTKKPSMGTSAPIIRPNHLLLRRSWLL